MSQVKHHVSSTGVQYWRSLEQLADTPAIRDLVAKEFPGYDADSISKGSRRGFLKFMGAAMALAGVTLTGCRRWPKEQLAPFSSNPEGRVPGVPEEYATAWEIGGVGEGLLVKSFDGRPIKIEGNQLHPFAVVSSGRYGASSKFAQATLLDMYDPQRSTGVSQVNGNDLTASTWEAFADAIHQAIQANPAGFAVLTEASASPSVLDMRQRVAKAFPQAKWYEYEAVSRDNELEGGRQAFGQAVRSRLYLAKADVVVLLDADVLGDHPAHIRYAADWAEKRRSADEGRMSRVYMIESTFSTTGSVADVRLGATPDRVYAVARAIAAGLGVAGLGQEQLSEQEQKFVTAAVADLKKAGRAGVVTAGEHASPATHALVHAINAAIGAVGNTVTLHADPAGNRPTHTAAIKGLTDAINGGQVATLLIIGGNPAYDAPADVDFKAALAKVGFSAHLSLYADETSRACKWHLPRAHFLEAWGDARAWDGTASIAQPLIEPLFGGRSVIEVLALLLTDDKVKAGEQIVRRTWQQQLGDEKAWRRALHDGVIANSAFPAVQAGVRGGNYPAATAPAQGTYTIRVQSDPRVYDGRFANNGWLQETPDALTKLVWDNAAVISMRDAKALGVEHGGMLKIDTPDNRSIELPAFILPGHPQGVITVTVGYGRTSAGPVGNELGFNTYSIVTTAAPSVIAGAKVAKTGKTYTLVTTQEHHIMEPIAEGAVKTRAGARAGESGKIIREAFFSDFKRLGPAKTFQKTPGIPLQLFEPPIVQNFPHAWGMTIDMNSCTGCGACLVACQAENNIPVVGKEESKRHREMNWIRVDRYFKGDAETDDVAVVHQVMMCQHCENAPCEQVCPVAATVHDTEGLNTMVYNRCIGTRYCSNNCPYKVRRFNYFDYHHKAPWTKWGAPWPGMPDEQQNDIDKIKRLVYNPDVTVRMRGVMEKCTYCVQRIHGATIAARAQGGDVKDGDILTACQQACATQAIVFGNYNEHDAMVTKLSENPRAYQVLEELNTRTRTRYLAKLRNPSDDATTAAPAETGTGGGGEHHG